MSIRWGFEHDFFPESDQYLDENNHHEPAETFPRMQTRSTISTCRKRLV